MLKTLVAFALGVALAPRIGPVLTIAQQMGGYVAGKKFPTPDPRDAQHKKFDPTA